MKPAGIIGTAALFLLLGTTAPLRAQEQKPREKPASVDKQDKGKGQSNEGKKADKAQKQNAAPQAKHEQQQPDAQQAPEGQGGQPQKAEKQQQKRLSRGRQQQLITEQQGRVSDYRQHLDQQQALAVQYAAQLQQQNRTANYRFQQEYVGRVRQQQLALQRSYDYDNDPYFYTAPSHRYRRGGSYYEINEYGANTLRQAINHGYVEGYRTGQADRQDRWSFDYRNSYAYQDANYGYNGYYVNQGEYNYYFRQGFHRGYQDGYYSRSQYGQYSNGSHSILGSILAQIVNFQSIR